MVTHRPDFYEIKYSLGLLLAELRKYEQAATYLKEAAEGLPQRARIHYNLGLLLQQLNRDSEAEASLKQALEIEPDNMDYLYALADFYIKRGKLYKAKGIAKQMIAKHPSSPLGPNLLALINKRLPSEVR